MQQSNSNGAGLPSASSEAGKPSKILSDELLGTRGTGRILLVCLDAPLSSAMAALRDSLGRVGHIVRDVSYEDWRMALESHRPDIILVEAVDETTATPLCRAVRGADARIAIMAMSPESADRDTLWPALQTCGVDDFLRLGCSASILDAHLGLLLRLASLGRECEALQERLSRHMQIDESTQLLNRRFFFQNAHRECSRSRRYGNALACLMIDIDYLEDIDKKFGNACVEYVLGAVAYAVRQWTRDSDLVGRFSDRKFAVLLPETDIDGATAVREKILEALAETKYEWEGEILPVVVAIGEAQRQVEMSQPNANDPSESLPEELETEPLSVREELASLLEDADAALEVARRASIRPGIFTQYTPGIQPPEAAK